MVTLVTNNIRGTGITESAYMIVVKSVIWNFFSRSMLLLAALLNKSKNILKKQKSFDTSYNFIGEYNFLFFVDGKSRIRHLFFALSAENFNASIFAGVLLTVLITSIYFMLQKISLAKIEAHIIIGAEKVMGLVMILVLSWALTLVTEELGFNGLITEGMIKNIHNFLILSVVFLIAGILAYTIGSSWATWIFADRAYFVK